MPSQTTPSPPSRRNFDRFIYYFSGLAIGCVMVGVLWQVRSCSAQRGGAGAGIGPAGAGVVAPQTKP